LVADTGIGIASEDKDRIFQEFVQVPNPLQAKVKGTGLGLPLAKKLSELLGGRIDVQSRPGGGSTFSVTLPLTWQDRAVAETRLAPHAPKILIIDDEEIARYLLRQSLAAPPECIEEAADGMEGVAKAHQGRPQAIFLDLMMPGMTGWEALKMLKADPVTREIPVLVITSKKLKDSDRAQLEPDAAAILSKEILSQQEATAEIRAALAKVGVHILENTRPGSVVVS
jgi:CheY-like chemotaxis protein